MKGGVQGLVFGLAGVLAGGVCYLLWLGRNDPKVWILVSVLSLIAVASGLLIWGLWSGRHSTTTQTAVVVVGVDGLGASAYTASAGVSEFKEADMGSGRAQVYASVETDQDAIYLAPDVLHASLVSVSMQGADGKGVTVTPAKAVSLDFTREGEPLQGALELDGDLDTGNPLIASRGILRMSHMDFTFGTVLPGSTLRVWLQDSSSGPALRGDKVLLTPGAEDLWLDTETGFLVSSRPDHPAAVPHIRDHRAASGIYPVEVTMKPPSTITFHMEAAKSASPVFHAGFDLAMATFFRLEGLSSPSEVVDAADFLLRASIAGHASLPGASRLMD